MLGSFDEQQHGETKPLKKTTSFSGQQTYVFTPPTKDCIKPPQDYTVMTAHRSGSAPQLGKFKTSGKSKTSDDDSATLELSTDTDVDVTPLPSDELTTERSSTGKPLTMSQLTSPLPSAKTPRGRPANGHVNGALKELRHLENRHGGSGGHHKSRSRHTTPTRGKENKQQAQQQHDAAVPGWLPLLHIPADRGGAGVAGGVRFPPLVPAPAWADQGMPQGEAVTLSGLPYMPLLRASSSTSDPQRFEPPERDPGLHPMYQQALNQQQYLPHDAYLHMPPLLHANWSQTPFMNLRDQYAVPRLVPPDELLDYEQRKYNKQNYKRLQLQAEIDEQLRLAAVARPGTPLGAQLLKADLEPFNERDDRDNEARYALLTPRIDARAVIERIYTFTCSSMIKPFVLFQAAEEKHQAQKAVR